MIPLRIKIVIMFCITAAMYTQAIAISSTYRHNRIIKRADDKYYIPATEEVIKVESYYNDDKNGMNCELVDDIEFFDGEERRVITAVCTVK